MPKNQPEPLLPTPPNCGPVCEAILEFKNRCGEAPEISPSFAI